MLPPLPAQPAGTPWPTVDWPTGALPARVDRARLEDHLARGMQDFDETHAVVIVQGGRLLVERYGPEHGPEATCLSWSKAKSLTHALVGVTVGDGLLDIHDPAPVAEWRTPGDPRGAITTDQLLRMSSGLEFAEVYEPDKPSDTIEMMWGSGKASVAHYAADKPLAHPPGAFFSYSSGTTNIVCRILADMTGLRGEAFAGFMRERLFGPLGMRTPLPKFDPAGTFIGSSFCFASGRDFARFGLLISARASGMGDESCRRDGLTMPVRPPSSSPASPTDDTARTGGWTSAVQALSPPTGMRASLRSWSPTSTSSWCATAGPLPTRRTS